MFKKQIKEEVFDFDKERMKKQILAEYERNNKKMNKYVKWSLIPICLVVIVGIIILYKNNSNISLNNPTYVDKENNLNFNKISEPHLLDVDVKTEFSDLAILWPDILIDGNGLKLPEDLDKTKAYVLFTKEEKSGEYTHLNSYVYNYYNEGKDRNIRMAFSKTEKPIRDYYFNEKDAKKSNINDYELLIYNYQKIYFAEFEIKGYNFDIETENITQEEFISLLKSIIN